MITEFGKYCRKLRIDEDESLLTMATKIGVNQTMLSTIERGKRDIPSTLGASIAEVYNLNELQRCGLNRAIMRSSSVLKIEVASVTDKQRYVAVAFSKALPDLTSSVLDNILHLMKSCSKSTI